MFGFGENKSRTFLQNGDPVGSINSASLHLRGKSMGYSEKVLDKKKNLSVFFLVFFVASGLLFVFAGVHTTHGAEKIPSLLDGMINLGMWGGEKIVEEALPALAWVFKWLLYGIFSLIGFLVSVAITLFGWAIDPKYISGNPGLFSSGSIYEMWKFIRDFFNLFFILVLLYIAFTVVFQIQKDFKKALLSLVLAALFINFSFPVTRFLIDATNVPMYFFANQMFIDKSNPGKSLGTVLKAAHLQKILLPNKEESDISQLLAAIVFMFIFAITLLVLAMMFVIRLVALLILLIFSPVGFAASIIPGMEQYAKLWWEYFWKYALFGPAAMLMLLIATRFFSEISDEKNALFAGMKIVAAGVTVPTELDFIASMAMFSIPIIMLWFAMGLAQKMSIAGASSVVGAGQKFAKWAGKSVTKTPALWAGRKLDSKLAEGRVTKYLSPGAWRTAFKNRAEEQKHNDEQPVKLAAATMQDQLNAGFSRVKNTILPTSWRSGKFMANTDHTDHRFEERQKQKNAGVKEITEVSDRSNIVIGKMEHAIASGDSAEVEAAIGVLAKNNDLNDLIIAVGHKYGGTNVVSSANAKTVLTEIFRQSGVTNDEDIAKSLTVLSDQALASGNYAFGGMSHYDDTTHTFSVSTPAQQASQVATKFNNLEPQQQARVLHPDALFKRDASGFTDMNDAVAGAIVPNISKATSDQSNRSRADMREALQNSWELVAAGHGTSLPNFVRNYNGNENFRYYTAKMLEQNGALDAADMTGDKLDWAKFSANHASI